MRRRRTAIFFAILGICLIALAVALNVGWIILNLREVALLVFGVIFFVLIITGVTLNTIFLLREIRRNEQHDAFLNAVTHELKTPIASIKLYLETLKNRELDRAKQQEFYDIMLSDSERLLGTVEQVLQASRAREKERLERITDVRLDEIIEETAQIVRTRHHLDDNVMRITHSAEAIEVFGDRDQLQTAFSNLLENAVKYSPVEPRIIIRTKLSGGYGEIYIKDNGIGIAKSDQARIFKMFERLNAGHDYPGTGMGLAIVHAAVERMRGRVGVESCRGEGSTFWIELKAP